MLKILAWIKNYWYIVLLIIGAPFVYIILRKTDAVQKVLRLASESYRKEKEAIDENKRLEEEEKKKIREVYDKAISEIEEKYEKDKEYLKDYAIKEATRIVKKFNGKPEELAKKFTDEFGIKFVKGL